MKEFETKMFNLYPEMLKGLTLNMSQSCLAFGFEIGKGWEPLIEQLLKDIDSEMKSNNIDDVEVMQVKEKFGGLRFYFNGGNDKIEKLVWDAEEKSYTICEVCGEKGEPNKGGWISTLCEKHREEKYNRLNL